MFLLRYQTYTLSILFPTFRTDQTISQQEYPHFTAVSPAFYSISPPVGSGGAPAHLHGICHLLHPQGRRTRPQMQHDMQTVCWVRSLHNSHLDRTQCSSMTSYKRCQKSNSLNITQRYYSKSMTEYVCRVKTKLDQILLNHHLWGFHFSLP